jgi:hypothetical protein
MRRLTQTEVGILVLAGLFIIAGARMVIYPAEENIFHPASRRGHPVVEHITKGRAQMYGGLAALIGAGLIGMVLYQRGK